MLQLHGGKIFLDHIGGRNGGQTVYRADFSFQTHGSEQTHSPEMGQNAVVRCQLGVPHAVFGEIRPVTEGWERFSLIAAHDEHIGFIERTPHLHPPPKGFKAHLGIGLKPLWKIGIQEPSLLLQTLGKIPMVQIHKGG